MTKTSKISAVTVAWALVFCVFSFASATLYAPIIYVCAAMATNPNHCEVVRSPQVTATLEACERLVRDTVEKFQKADPFPFPHLAPQLDVPNDIIIHGQCSAEVLYETMVVQAK